MLTPFSLLTHSQLKRPTPLFSPLCFLSIVPIDRGRGEREAGGKRKEERSGGAERQSLRSGGECRGGDDENKINGERVYAKKYIVL